MGRVGIFLCDCPFSPLNTADVEELLTTIRRSPDVAYAGLHPDMCLHPVPEKIAGVIAENRLEGAVFTSCSSMLYKDAFANLASAAGLAPNQFAVVDFNEQIDGREASESLIEAVERLAAESTAAQPVFEASLPVTRKALIIGGGVAGIQAALDIADAGYKHIRLRTNWPADEKLFNALDQQISDCLEYGLIPIIAYQAGEAEENPDTTHRNQVIDWWRTVAGHYQDYTHKLVFNLIIEVSGALKNDSKTLNSWYELIVSAIRDSNPTRLIAVSPVNLSDPYYLHELEIPSESNGYLIGEWHFYASGPSKTSDKKLWTTGTENEKKLLTDKIDAALAWEQETGVPTWVGAWMPGNYNKGNDYTIPEQVVFASFMVRELEKAEIPWAVNAVKHFYDYMQDSNTWTVEKLPVRDVMLDPWKVALYENIGYGGKSIRLGTGDYDKTFLADKGFLNNISSVMVPDGMKLTIYSEAGFSGNESIFTNTDSCIHVGNDTVHVSSIRIEKNSPTGIKDEHRIIPNDLLILNNYPNPFNPTTKIYYKLANSNHVTLKVYNLTGQEVVTLVDGMKTKGKHYVQFNAASLPSGVYYYVLELGAYRASHKMLFMK